MYGNNELTKNYAVINSSSYVKVAKINDIPVGTIRSFMAEGREYPIANVDGNFYAFDNACSHLVAPLAEGELTGRVFICPKHHASFDVMTGKALTVYGHDLNKYDVKVEGTDILIEI